ncbi:SPX domain-containing protein [Cokeromyces recurvatus]|uniref:SPX domain-containing protein n=1 Tax=Cokeromyces recurvatus TaxID=90255 RepID=UPI00222107AE|nr:SPX domain-containing protein [Cokeromyces recurvatus]KAI7902686.1 SPX domain-containing protein [Cokeromyces recurvatus]
MKFSHQIQFNAVPDWADYYLPYSNLKKLIYLLEKERIANKNASVDDIEGHPSEHTALITESPIEVDNQKFLDALNKALERIIKFYAKKETELYDEMSQLIGDFENLDNFDAYIASQLRRSSINHDNPLIEGEHEAEVVGQRVRSNTNQLPRRESNVDGDSFLPPNIISQNVIDTDPMMTDETPLLSTSERPGLVWPREAMYDVVELRKRTVDLFVLLSELKSFVALNLTAFAKILKKYDKITNGNLKRYYMATYVTKAYPFKTETKTRLNEKIQQTERAYAILATGNNLDLAVEELKTHLREHIVWERNTVWRDLISQERKTQTVGLSDTKPSFIHTPFGTLHVTRGQIMNYLYMIVSIIVFAVLLRAHIFENIEQNRCLAILVFSSMLWAGEVMPLFVTALLVPFLIIILRVMRSDDGHYSRLDAPDATKRVFSAMFSPVIMLLLGGFSIAGALSKFGIAKSMATFVLSKAGTRPNYVLFVNMMVATIASMWISNVAAPVLCFSLIQPILRTLPVDSKFGPCLIMGIALASNLGGMASPISSPQNIIAIQNMTPAPSWIEWFVISIPLCIIGNLIIWLWLLYNYNPEKQTPQIHTIRANTDPITGTQIYVIMVTLITIILWCLAHSYEHIFGDMGVIAIIPLIAFFGTGLLTKDDFNNFLWNVIMLAMGGIALGKAVESSGLLKTIASQIENMVQGLSAFEVLFVFSCLVLFIATFISHTVAALIVLPIVAEVGSQLADPQPRMLVMGTAFVCSAAMGLPVSGFPNMNAISQEDELGKPYLTTKDFLVNGVPSSIFAMLCITTIGYGLMALIGF